MFTLLYIVLFISLLSTLTIIFSPIWVDLASNRRVRMKRKIDRMIKNYIFEGNYKKFTRKMKKVGKISSQIILDAAVQTISKAEPKILECFDDDDVSVREFMKKSKLDKRIKKKLLSGEDYEIYQALCVSGVLKLSEVIDIIESEFNYYSGQGQFYILYSLLEINDEYTYQKLLDNYSLKFNHQLLDKLEEFREYNQEILDYSYSDRSEETVKLGEYYG